MEQIFKSPAIRKMLTQVERACGSRDGLLVCGEHGTGRESVARLINRGGGEAMTAVLHGPTRPHDGGHDPVHLCDRVAGANPGPPFFSLDCGTPDVRALEASIFGTFAREAAGRAGVLDVVAPGSRLVQACGGTIVLRNLGDLPVRLQVRLARILRDGEALLADADRTRLDLDVRLVALLEPDYDRLVGEGRLAPELMKRFGGPRIDVPALQARREDLPGLVVYLIDVLSCVTRMPAKRVSSAAMQLLIALPWRGNLPELRGLLQVLMVKVRGPVIRLADVLSHVRLDGSASPVILTGTLREARERFEREYVALVLEQHKGRMAEAAKALGIQRTNLYRKVRRLAVHRPGGSRRRA